jgi:hypothetical protein
MTTHRYHHPQRPHHRTRPAGTPPPATRDDSPRVAAAVPITVWRLDHRDDPPTAEPADGFAARLATQLLLIYTGHGEVVVDLDDDPRVRRAAAVTGRTYLAVTGPSALTDLHRLSKPVSLVTLRWPRAATALPADHTPTDHVPAGHVPAGQVTGLLTACRQMMSGDASVVALIRADKLTPPHITFADYERSLRIAAEAAGFTHVLQIVAVSAPGGGDQFLYNATESDASLAVHQATTSPDGQITSGQGVSSHVMHVDVSIFAARAHRHG